MLNDLLIEHERMHYVTIKIWFYLISGVRSFCNLLEVVEGVGREWKYPQKFPHLGLGFFKGSGPVLCQPNSQLLLFSAQNRLKKYMNVI